MLHDSAELGGREAARGCGLGREPLLAARIAGLERRLAIRVSIPSAILKYLSRLDMTTCDGCKKTIWLVPFEKDVKVGHTERAGNQRDTHYEPVVKCLPCYLKGRALKALNDLAWRAVTALGPRGLGVIAILGMLAVSSFFIENKNAPSPAAITAVGSRPILIPPENRDAWRR